jgi:hypothetical protein
MATILPLNKTVLAPFIQQNDAQNNKMNRPKGAYGVFGSVPLSTPKYARHRNRGDSDYLDTMARMFIRVPPEDYKVFLQTLKDPDTRKIAACLTGDDAGKGGVGYIDFLLDSVNQGFKEKVDVVETLSDNYVAYFFGQSAPMFTFQGTLYNTYEDDWAMRMFRIYRDLARGTQLARQGLEFRIRYDSVIVTGAMLDFNYSNKSGNETSCPFSFSLLVTKHTILYGAMSEPTKLVNAGSFTPQGFFDPSDQQDTAAQQTYLELPKTQDGGPQGVSVSAAEAEADTSYAVVLDAAGNPISQNPEEYEVEDEGDVAAATAAPRSSFPWETQDATTTS